MILTKIVQKLPIIKEYYNHYWDFPRRTTACRGVFKTFEQALHSLPSNSRIGFNQSDIHEHPAVSQLTAGRDLEKIHSSDYPVLLWLSFVLADSSKVFDFGGNVGVSYYTFRKYLDYPDKLRWTVLELPEIVKAGKDLASKTDSPGLSFTEDFSEVKDSDILLTCGTLQYLDLSLADLLRQAQVQPKHILINMTPFYEGETFVTIQNIGYAFSAYKIQNQVEFLNSLNSLGYKLIDSWEIDRSFRIPFHPEHFVPSYRGFYLQLK